MRKLTSLMICVLMLAALVLPAGAETPEVTTFKLTADKTEVSPGDQVTVTVEVDQGVACTSFGVLVQYDKALFKVVDVTCEKNPGGFSGGWAQKDDAWPDFVGVDGKWPGIVAMNYEDGEAAPQLSAKVPQGLVGKVVLEAYDNATVGETDSIKAVAKTSVNGATAASPEVSVGLTIVERTGLWGDADGNGRVNVGDSLLIQKYYMGDITADELDLSVCDVDGNDRCNVGDSLLIQQKYMGDIELFPVEK